MPGQGPPRWWARPTAPSTPSAPKGDDVIVAPLGNQGRGPGPRGQRHGSVWSMGASGTRRAIRSSRSTPGLGTTQVQQPDGPGRWAGRRRARSPVRTTYVGNDFPESACTDRCPRGGPRGRHRHRTSSRPAAGSTWITSGAAGVAEPRQASRRARQRQHLVRAVHRPEPCSTTVRSRRPPPGTWSSHGRASSSSTTSLAVPASAGSTVLSWTSVDGFSMRAAPAATSPSSAPTRDEETSPPLRLRPATWPRPTAGLHGWRRRQRPTSELPAQPASTSVRATTPPDLPWPATAPTSRWPSPQNAWAETVVELSTALAGDRVLPRPQTANGLTVEGSRPRRSHHGPVDQYVTGPQRSGADHVFARRGPDHAGPWTAAATTGSRSVGDRGVILNGGRGADVLRGDRGPDPAPGRPRTGRRRGASRARTECKTEVRHSCELP